MTLDEITKAGIDPAISLLNSFGKVNFDSQEARVLLLAIGLQESRFTARRQLVGSPPKPTGPAKSFWQGEMGGGLVYGARHHPATKSYASQLCEARGVEQTNRSVWDAIENDDVLAAGLARLLIYTDPFTLPKLGDSSAAWRLYADRCWRPGKPHPETWGGFYKQAMAYVCKK